MSTSRLERRISESRYTVGTEFERTSKAFARRLVPDGPPALCILDVGCGTGLNVRHFASSGHDVTGIDLSPTAILAFCQAGFKGVVGDVAEGLPFPDGSFDLVFASEVIEHLSDTRSFLQELHRVLKTGGRLILTTPNSAFWAYRVWAFLGKTLSEVQHPGHIRFFSKRSLTESILQAGFSIERSAGRHMYLILPGIIEKYLPGILEKIGFQREVRFRTLKIFYHWSAFSVRASGWWSDTLIMSCIKHPAGAP